MLLEYAEIKNKPSAKVVDIGARTGNLSVMLLERGLEVIAVEPNDAMGEIGIDKTEGANIELIRATDIKTTLDNKCADWVTFGSSLNVMDRDLNDPIQKEAENIIVEFIPDYDRGVRRQDQRPKIEEHKDKFDEIFYLGVDFYFHQTLENYIKAWKNVKNKYWDLEAKEGQKLFEAITNKMREALPKEFDIKYTTRAWTTKKVS